MRTGKGAVDRLALKGLGAYQLYIGAECRYFNTAASHELMLPLGHCPNRHFLKYAACAATRFNQNRRHNTIREISFGEYKRFPGAELRETVIVKTPVH